MLQNTAKVFRDSPDVKATPVQNLGSVQVSRTAVAVTPKKKVIKRKRATPTETLTRCIQYFDLMANPPVPCFLCDLFGVSANKLKEQLLDTEAC